jgi:hypothetical protein
VSGEHRIRRSAGVKDWPPSLEEALADYLEAGTGDSPDELGFLPEEDLAELRTLAQDALLERLLAELTAWFGSRKG